jgi:hypothetical protein
VHEGALCPLSSAVCNATIPTLPLFEIVEFTCSPFCYVLHYLLFLSLYGFLSLMRDWTVKLLVKSTVYLKIWLYNNLDMFTYLTILKNSECFLVSSQINESVSRNRHTPTVDRGGHIDFDWGGGV